MMSRVKLLTGSQAIQVDVIWLFWIMVAFLLFLYVPVYIDTEPTLAAKAQIGFGLLIGGTFMGAVLCGFKTDKFFSLEEFVNSLGFVFIGILSIFMVNIYTSTVQLSGVPISGTLFVMLMAVAEEALFRGFLTTAFTKMANSSLIGVGVSSVVGVAYHAAVYGTSNTNLLIVFGSFCVLGFTYVLSGNRLSIPMTAHVIVNYLASTGV